MNLRPRIALFRGTGVVSRLIRWQTRSEYSHAALVLPDSLDRVVESREFAGVQLRTLTEHEMRAVDYYAIPSMTDEQFEVTLQLAMRELGAPYDYWSVARFVSHRPARVNHKWFCSEFVHKLLADGGVRLLNRIPSAEVAPCLLAYSPLTKHVVP